MRKINARLFQADNSVYIECEFLLRSRNTIRIDEWVRMGTQRRALTMQHIVESFDRDYTNAHNEAMQAQIRIGGVMILDIIKQRPYSPERQIALDAANMMLREILARTTGAKSYAFELGNVGTLARTEISILTESRAPYSYEFESAPLPAPPVVPDMYWGGANR